MLWNMKKTKDIKKWPPPTLDILPGCWPHVLTLVKVSKNTQMNFPYHTVSASQHVHHFKPIKKIWKKCWKIINHFPRRGYAHPPFAENNHFFFIGLKWCTCCEVDSVWHGKFIWVFFDTFTKVKTCGRGQHPGRMSRLGVWGHFYVFSFFHVSEHSEHFLSIWKN